MTAAGDILSALRSIGATIQPAGDRLVLRAGSRPVPASMVRRAREAKPELLALLCQEAVPAEGAQISRRCSLPKVSAFGKGERLRNESSLGRAAPTVNSEPGLEQPSLARRGRVVVLDNGAILHFCLERPLWRVRLWRPFESRAPRALVLRRAPAKRRARRTEPMTELGTRPGPAA
jgi:hypothetical protein